MYLRAKVKKYYEKGTWYREPLGNCLQNPSTTPRTPELSSQPKLSAGQAKSKNSCLGSRGLGFRVFNLFTNLSSVLTIYHMRVVWDSGHSSKDNERGPEYQDCYYTLFRAITVWGGGLVQWSLHKKAVRSWFPRSYTRRP